MRNEINLTNVKDTFGNTLLHLVIMWEELKLVKMFAKEYKYLLSVRNKAGTTPLGKAVLMGNDMSAVCLLRIYFL